MTTWMIVEDEPGIYEMLLAMSDILGNEGIAFVDGDEAIAWIDEVDGGRYDGELPELALVDIRLPTEVSGPMVGARVRQSPTVGHMGVVLMTAYHLSEEEEQACIAQAGADLLLTKPLPSVAEMQKRLAEVVAKRAAMQPAAPVATPAPAAPSASAPSTPSAMQKPPTAMAPPSPIRVRPPTTPPPKDSR